MSHVKFIQLTKHPLFNVQMQFILLNTRKKIPQLSNLSKGNTRTAHSITQKLTNKITTIPKHLKQAKVGMITEDTYTQELVSPHRDLAPLNSPSPSIISLSFDIAPTISYDNSITKMMRNYFRLRLQNRIMRLRLIQYILLMHLKVHCVRAHY